MSGGRTLEPLFVTVPPRPQRLLHSEAYIKYCLYYKYVICHDFIMQLFYKVFNRVIDNKELNNLLFLSQPCVFSEEYMLNYVDNFKRIMVV